MECLHYIEEEKAYIAANELVLSTGEFTMEKHGSRFILIDSQGEVEPFKNLLGLLKYLDKIRYSKIKE